MKSIIFALIFFLTGLVNGQKSTFKTITINPYLSFQNYEHFKRLTLSSPGSSIEYLKGFEFKWGYIYKLKVKQTKLKSTLSDGTQYEHSLKKVISKTKMHDTTHFKLLLDANRYYHKVDSSELELNQTFNKINDSTFLYFDKVEIMVPSTLIEEFKIVLEDKSTKFGVFCFVDEKRIRLLKL